MNEIVKHINDTNASYRTPNAGDAKNTDLFLDNEHYELFKDAGEQIIVRFSKENLSRAILFIASILPRKYDNSAIHKSVAYSPDFVYDQLAFLDYFFKEDGASVDRKTQTWNARKDVPKKNGEIDNRFYFNGLLEDVEYVNSKGDHVTSKFTIRNYLAGGYSDLHIKKAEYGIFDVWVTNVQEPYFDDKEDGLEKNDNSTSSKNIILESSNIADFMGSCLKHYLTYDPNLSKTATNIKKNNVTIGFTRCQFGKTVESQEAVTDSRRMDDCDKSIRWNYENVDYYFFKEQSASTLEVFTDSMNKIYGDKYIIEINGRTYYLYEVVLSAGTYINKPLQRVFYGAPGTGKSHEIKIQTSEYDVIRTTFHPDSDYSSFVGAYKPVTDDDGKIVYKFVQQAFTKSYVEAWKKMLYPKKSSRSLALNRVITTSSATYEIIGIDEDTLYTIQKFEYKKEYFSKAWSYISDNKDTIYNSAYIFERALCDWVKKDIGQDGYKKEVIDDAWNHLVMTLQDKSISIGRNGKYELYKGESNDYISVKTPNNHSIDTLKDYFEGNVNANRQIEVKTKIIDILNKFSSKFSDAWKLLTEAFDQDEAMKEVSMPEFLVIEEINRGNCAQIFGDLFQLLDRNKEGFSEYPIHADSDLARILKEEFNAINFDTQVISQINGLYDEADVMDKVTNGQYLLLPKNLYIWATMNTSDQSLFPIDSAFKRRWDWEYVPIDYKDAQQFTIKLKDDISFNWSDFIQSINEKIAKDLHSSAKQLGNRFVNPSDKIITTDMFINKVLFYLFNDAYKDDEDFARYFFGQDAREDAKLFEDIYDADADKEELCKNFIEKLIKDFPPKS